MSTDTARLVTESFHRVAPRADELVELFYETMFSRYPEVRALFPDRMDGQQGKLKGALVLAVRSLSAPEALTVKLEEMGAAHHSYGVRDEHFAIVGECLLHAIEAHDEAFDPPTLAAWTAVYGFMAEAMQRGMARARDVALAS